jgi:hypothetical protein
LLWTWSPRALHGYFWKDPENSFKPITNWMNQLTLWYMIVCTTFLKLTVFCPCCRVECDEDLLALARCAARWLRGGWLTTCCRRRAQANILQWYYPEVWMKQKYSWDFKTLWSLHCISEQTTNHWYSLKLNCQYKHIPKFWVH